VQLCDWRSQNQGLGTIDLGIKVSGFIEYPNRIKPNYRGNPGSSNKHLLASKPPQTVRLHDEAVQQRGRLFVSACKGGYRCSASSFGA